MIALSSVNVAPTAVYPEGDVSPFGYTISLVLFGIPVLALMGWFGRHRARLPRHWQAFWITFGIIVVLWSGLDMLLARTLFTFPNPDATMGLDLPGYVPGEGWQLAAVPIEEFVFYISGCAVILLLYIWGSELWYPEYTANDDAYIEAGQGFRLGDTWHWQSLSGGLALLGAAYLIKQVMEPGGFPWYFAFLVLIIVVPSGMAFRLVLRFINMRAFLFTIQSLLAVSIIWEVTLALPYGWWGYNHEYMMGLYLRAWFDLPVEAPMLWLAAAWSNVAIYELAKLKLFADQPLRAVFSIRKSAA